MKCQRCHKQATLHITEVLADDKFDELHLCEDCAKKYLYEPAAKKGGGKGSTLTDADVGDDAGGKVCDVCGIKFVEFRNSGRLGCPHDYDAFKAELIPLLESIHGDVRHPGKTPRKRPTGTGPRIDVAGLRKKLQKAVDDEKYEEAAKLRDAIRRAEEG